MTTEQRQLCNSQARGSSLEKLHPQLTRACNLSLGLCRSIRTSFWRLVSKEHLHAVAFVPCWMSRIRCNKPSASLCITPAPFRWAAFPPGTNPSPSSRFPVPQPKPK